MFVSLPDTRPNFYPLAPPRHLRCAHVSDRGTRNAADVAEFLLAVAASVITAAIEAAVARFSARPLIEIRFSIDLSD